MQYIDFLVKNKATGSLNSFANKNKLSKSGLMNILLEMKEIGFPIKYSRQYNSYYYEEDGAMVKCLFMRDGQRLSKDEMRNINTADLKNLCFSNITIFEICEKK